MDKSIPPFLNKGPSEIMIEYGAEIETAMRHDGGTYLAQADAMPPPRPRERETLTIGRLTGHEGRAVKVSWREQTANFKFLAYGDAFCRAHNFQLEYAPGWTALNGDEVHDTANIYSSLCAK